LLVLVLLGVTLVTLSDQSGNRGIFGKARSYARDIANPFQSAVHALLQPVGDFISGALDYKSLEAQNDVLRQQVADGQAAAARAEAAEEEADQVLAEEDLGYLGSIQTVTAQVIDVGSANVEQSIEVNRGSDSGIAFGQPVVSSGGLIGSVSSVSSHLATITLLDDPAFTVGVRVLPPPEASTGAQHGTGGRGRRGSGAGPTSTSSTSTSSTLPSSGATTPGSAKNGHRSPSSAREGAAATAGDVVGAAVGEGEGNQLQVQDVNVGESVERGDVLVTSGLVPLELFPAGLPVATVESVSSPAGALQLSISAQPLADLGNLQFVQILLWSPQTG
jgi:cell shape-determining protein MreC